MSNFIIDKFFNDLNDFLCNFAETNGLEKVFSDFKPIISRENGSKIKADFSLSFISPKFHLWHKYLAEIGQQLVVESREWKTFSVKKYTICDRIRRIQLFVCRQTSVERLIENFNQILGNNNRIEENLLIICVTFDVKNRFTSERQRLIAQSLSKLLNNSCINLNHNILSDEKFSKVLTFAINSDYCESLDKNKLLFRDKSVGTGEADESKSLIIDKTLRFVFEFMSNLYELIENYVKNDRKEYKIVLVVSESLCYRIRQSFQLMCLLYDLKRLKLKLIPVSNVNTDQEFVDYIKSLNEKLLEQNTDSMDQNSDNFQTITETSLTLALMSTTPSSVISRLGLHLNESIFIQYNCARLKAIISRYNNEFVANSRADTSADLSLLTHDLEWSLLFNQFCSYESLIRLLQEFVSNDKTIGFNINQLILFLKQFVAEVSVYYKKVKVLTEPSPHLLPLIGARIYFCKLLLQVLTVCLNILGLKTVDYL